MLTVRFDKLPVGPGSMFLDAGAGFGRHAFEAARRGARVVALDYAEEETTVTRATFAAMFEAGEIKSENLVAVLRGDATRLREILQPRGLHDGHRGGRARLWRRRSP